MVLPNFFTSAPQFFGCVFSQLRPATIILHKFKAHSRLRCLTGTPQKTLKRLAPGSKILRAGKGHRQFGVILNLDTNFPPMIHFWTVKCPPENIQMFADWEKCVTREDREAMSRAHRRRFPASRPRSPWGYPHSSSPGRTVHPAPNPPRPSEALVLDIPHQWREAVWCLHHEPDA